MSPLVFFMLVIYIKHVKVEEINFTKEDTGQLIPDEELQKLLEDGFYEYKVDELEYEVMYMKIRIFTKLELRTALKDSRRFWTNGIVPYIISKKYDPKQKAVILEGMEAFKNHTCIRFTSKKNESAFILIQPGFGCSATIGKVSKSFVKLGNGCYQKGIVIHELLHVLGFIHEQSRPDRDDFVKINYDNINEKNRKNFDKYSKDIVQTGNISYDYESIMHYGAFTFAKNKSVPTIIPLRKNVTIGQRRDFSKKDIEKINIFYNCNKQVKKRVKRHDNGAQRTFDAEPINTPQRRIFPAAYPSNARKVEYGSGLSPVDYSSPKFTPVRNPRPDHRVVYPSEVYHAPLYTSGDRRIPPVPYSNPIQAPVNYEWPAYSPVEPPKSLYGPVEQPKVSYFPESEHAPATLRRLNFSSVEYRREPEGHHDPPSRNYRKPETSRPYYTTPGYQRMPYPPMDYPKPVHARPSYTTSGYRRPSYTTAGYRRPSYAPKDYPKIDYSPAYPVYSSPSYYNDRYPPVMKPYTQPYYDTTLVTLSPVIQTETTTTTEIIAETETTSPAPTSIIEQTTTSEPTSIIEQTTTSDPTSTVAVTTTAAPTSTVDATTTALPTSTIEETTAETTVTTTVAITDAPTSTQEYNKYPQTSTIIPTFEITTTTDHVTLSPTEKEYVKPYGLDLSSRNSEDFGTEEEIHSIGFHKIHVFPNIESRTALRDPTALWTKGIVPYEFSNEYDSQQKGFLLEAMQELQNKTCVRFVPRSNQATYIFVEPELRCSAHIGKVAGSVNSVKISEGCYLQGTIIHELMHALGFVHEQNRPDRDQFVIVMWENIIPEAKKNFRKYTWDEVQDFGQGYDYESIMHYSSTEFSKDPDRPTLVPLQAGVKLGQRDGLSRKDVAKINRLYKCRMEQDKEVVAPSPVEEFKKYFQSNIVKLFRNLLRAIQNFRPSKPKNT